jgi:hypothetical protein
MSIPDIKGGKAKGLEELTRFTHLGYSVPEYDEIGFSQYESVQKRLEMANLVGVLKAKIAGNGPAELGILTELPPELDENVNQLLSKYKGEDIIVRSNSFLEDGKLSFAGRYDSVVVKELSKDKLVDAMLQVYNSLHSKKAQEYWQEHNISTDKMGIIVQKFIEPEYSGVMYTSNPTYPDDLTIELVKGRIDDENRESFILDYDKKEGSITFASENFNKGKFKGINLFRLNRYFDQFFKIGVEIEKEFGASDIEFLINESDDLYLVQRRLITDLQQPEKIIIPKYNKEQFIGTTNTTRGTGKYTLPVLKIVDYVELLDKLQMVASFSGNNDIIKEKMGEYFEDIKEKDEFYKEGYVLVLPHFHESCIERLSSVFGYNTTIDALTPNKKAIITTNCGLISSHAMTVAREKGIVYAGFMNDPYLFEDVSSGDMLSIYFKGRKAIVFEENV